MADEYKSYREKKNIEFQFATFSWNRESTGSVHDDDDVSPLDISRPLVYNSVSDLETPFSPSAAQLRELSFDAGEQFSGYTSAGTLLSDSSGSGMDGATGDNKDEACFVRKDKGGTTMPTKLAQLDLAGIDSIKPLQLRQVHDDDSAELRIGLDGGDDRTTAGLSPFDIPTFNPSPKSMSRAVTMDTSNSNSSFKSDEEEEWNEVTILEMTDFMRATIKTTDLLLSKADIENLSILLKTMSEDEENGKPIPLNIIVVARLDLLLEELYAARRTLSKYTKFSQILKEASTLHCLFQRRLKGKWYGLDKERIDIMTQSGQLRCMRLSEDRSQGDIWSIHGRTHGGDREGGLDFKPGDWFLNLYCAFRDGIVGTVRKSLTKGRYGAVALVLACGEEVDGKEPGTTIYTQQGPMGEGFISVMDTRGRPIRLLRDYGLKSKYAPRAGIRYDGLYLVKQFGWRCIDFARDKYCCEITLERVRGQTPVDVRAPIPSQLDDWKLYQGIISADYRKHHGDVEYSKWKEFEDQKLQEKEAWLMSRTYIGDLKQSDTHLGLPKGKELAVQGSLS